MTPLLTSTSIVSDIFNIIAYGAMGLCVIFLIYAFYLSNYGPVSRERRETENLRIQQEAQRRAEYKFVRNLKEQTGIIARKEIYVNHEPRQDIGYQLYIGSPQWRETRRLMLMKRGQTCERCKRYINNLFDLHLHHLTYDDLYNEYEEDLQFLCKECHEREHRLDSQTLIGEYQIEIMEIKEILEKIINSEMDSERGIERIRSMIMKRFRLARTKTHPLDKIYRLFDNILEPETVIDLEEIKRINSLIREL